MPYDCRLYLLTPPTLPADFADTLTAALESGDVAALQLRLPDADDDAILRAADLVRPVAHARGVAVILEGRPDLVVQAGCDHAPDVRQKVLRRNTQLAMVNRIATSKAHTVPAQPMIVA